MDGNELRRFAPAFGREAFDSMKPRLGDPVGPSLIVRSRRREVRTDFGSGSLSRARSVATWFGFRRLRENVHRHSPLGGLRIFHIWSDGAFICRLVCYQPFGCSSAIGFVLGLSPFRIGVVRSWFAGESEPAFGRTLKKASKRSAEIFTAETFLLSSSFTFSKRLIFVSERENS